jgi:hypothetical protein
MKNMMSGYEIEEATKGSWTAEVGPGSKSQRASTWGQLADQVCCCVTGG